jgi:hypothetical protein
LDPRAKFPKVLRNAVDYCGVSVFLDTTTLYDHYLMGESSLIEGMCVELGLVRKLYCEAQLVDQSRIKSDASIDAAIWKIMDLSRESVSRAITSQKPSGDLILQTLEAQKSSSCEDHPGFRVTVAFWNSVVGDGSEVRLQRELLACLPHGATRVTPAEALTKMDMLARSTFYGFLGIGPRANFTTARKFVDALKDKRMPNYDTARNSVLLTAIMQACAQWCEFEKPAGSAAAQISYGLDAIKLHFEKATTLQASNLFKESAPHLSHCVVFGWLLTQDQRDEVVRMGDAGASADLAEAAKKKMVTVASCKAKVGRKTVKPSARDAVLSMLG